MTDENEQTRDKMTTEEALRLLDVSRSTLQRIEKSGELLPVWVRGAKRWRRAEVEAFNERLPRTKVTASRS